MATDDELASAATMVGATQPSQPGASASASESPPSVIADRYEIQALLGAGGMGRVYRAHDRALDEVVALKMLRRELLGTPRVLERFRQEVKLARRVSSPHVVRTFDLGEHAGEHFLTMEYIDGRSLAQLLDDGPLAFAEAVRIARGAAAGIAAAHGNGVLHRDLKPDNVLVARDGRVVITDFGVACATASPVVTGDRFAGTPAYMSPEQVEGAGEIGPASDVYAFGAILYEMLTGRRPFPGHDPIQVAIARLRQPPPDPRSVRAVPAALAELAVRCMARALADRPRDGAALGDALARIDDSAPTTAIEEFVPAVPAKTSRSVAILPLRAAGELAELGDGLAEEIVDALTMTKALRVRPLASVRKAVSADADARDIGKALGVDVIVDGSIRRRGDQVRIAARVIGVADGFQLWASHFDARPDGLLAASDDVVRAIARALTVDVAPPVRPAIDPRATEIYLEVKAKLRATWLSESRPDLASELERARALAPDDANILATLAVALARTAFYGYDVHRLPEARRLALRAVELAPASGEAWFALGVANFYAGTVSDAARALVQAVIHAPGFAMAQALLGSMLLEAGALDLALSHLEAALSLDPEGSAHIDLPRAYVYADRWDDAIAELERARRTPERFNLVFDDMAHARFAMWRGERRELTVAMPPHAREDFDRYFRVAKRVHASGTLTADDRRELEQVVTVPNPRLRATRLQFVAEYLVFAGYPEDAVRTIARSVEAGLQDHLWIQRCPLLAPLREHPEFRALADQVAERAQAVLAVVHDAEHGHA